MTYSYRPLLQVATAEVTKPKYLPELLDICTPENSLQLQKIITNAIIDGAKELAKVTVTWVWNGVVHSSIYLGITGTIVGILLMMCGEHKGEKIAIISTVGCIVIQAINLVIEINM